MKWLKKIVVNWVKDDWYNSSPVQVDRHGDILDNHDGMRFRIYGASGGHIVEFSYYDRKTDQHGNTLHIIRSEEDFAESLAKIVTYEKLRA